MQLPIDEVLPELDTILAKGSNAVLVAEPGAGKTTRVPLHCLKSEWLGGKKIIMLEPRRLAARSAVSYMAAERGEKVGETLGFRVRGESRVGPRTQIEVVTEGILTRIIQAQPELDGIGLIIFDEFHERSLHADLTLALCLEIQRSIRPDLRILVMSATLDAEAVAKLIGADSVVKCAGRTFPVKTKYLEQKADLPLDRLVSDCIRRALKETEGDLLVFLPGRSEISWVGKRLEEKPLPVPSEVLTLYSDMTFAQQDLVLRAKQHGKRKIILATSIAETSLTIDGIRVVIDSGLMRVPKFDSRRGMSGLETVSVSQASAEQRKGRAGRQAPGTCYRLWTEYQHKELPQFNEPEILQTDLTSLALELSLWGQRDFKNFSFITPPPQKTYEQGQSLLFNLGACDSSGLITKHGREMSKLGVSPRIAHMLIKASELNAINLACDIAALLEEKSVLSDRSSDLEISSRWHALDKFRNDKGDRVDSRSVLGRVDKESERLRAIIGANNRTTPGAKNTELIGILTAIAYPDRIAKRREAEGVRYLLRNGSGVSLPDPCIHSRSEYLAVAHLDGSSEHGRIFLCEPILESEILEYFGSEIVKSAETAWDENNQILKSRELQSLGALTLSERAVALSEDSIADAMLKAIRSMGLNSLPWDKESESLVARSEWLRRVGLVDESWPNLCKEFLLDSSDVWLAPYLFNIRSKAELQKINLISILLGIFSWEQRKQLDLLAPAYFVAPTGTRVDIDYECPSAPLMSVRLQEMLGQSTTPKVGNGKFAVTVELLSPARRPLQITKDLEHFWKTSYNEVRKEMQGRYPRHVWPLDPATAQATKRIKKFSS